jgi:hypothetical protein
MSGEARPHICCRFVQGRRVLIFDTGLGARSFAQAKLSRFVTEQGFIVSPRGDLEEWKAGGTSESESSGDASMLVWGPAFMGRRLDILVNEGGFEEALAGVSAWIQALLSFEENSQRQVPLSCAFIAVPDMAAGAPFADRAASGAVATDAAADPNLGDPNGYYPRGTVFFAPENLVRQCILAEGEESRLGGEQYIHPDLSDWDAALFTAAAMLYRIFSGFAPFTAPDELTLREDMRQGNFMPVHFACPGLEEEFARSIQQALSPRRTDGPQELLLRLNKAVKAAGPWKNGFFETLSEGELKKLTEKREKFRQRKNISVKTRRFVTRNISTLLAIPAALLILVFAGLGVSKSRAAMPTTAGMDSLEVVQCYYNALGEMDHRLMEVCAARGAGKNDINMVSSFFIAVKVRQTYEPNRDHIISAREWLELGSPALDKLIFGITDLRILPENEKSGVRFRASFTLWLPQAGETPGLSQCYHCVDDLELAKIRGNWRIIKINRTQK